MSNRKPQEARKTDKKRTAEARQTTLDRRAARRAKRGGRS